RTLVTVRNNGPASATNVTWTSALGAAIFDGVTTNGNISCVPPTATPGQTLTCTIASLSAGQSTVQNFFLIAPSTLGNYTNTVTVSAPGTIDPVPGNDSSSVTVAITS